jgi:hypothetical protein
MEPRNYDKNVETTNDDHFLFTCPTLKINVKYELMLNYDLYWKVCVIVVYSLHPNEAFFQSTSCFRSLFGHPKKIEL